MADDLGWEAVSGVGGALWRHPSRMNHTESFPIGIINVAMPTEPYTVYRSYLSIIRIRPSHRQTELTYLTETGDHLSLTAAAPWAGLISARALPGNLAG